MKLSPRDAPRYFERPEADRTGVLIYGPDAMRVALKRQQVIAALVGPQGEEEMRLTRIPASELRKDPARLQDAIKAQGFFPGPRVVFVEDANDIAAPVITATLPSKSSMLPMSAVVSTLEKSRGLERIHVSPWFGADAEKRLEVIAENHEGIQRLQTIPGVGPRTAEVIVTALDDVTRFNNAR